jgi:quinol monooxygenase YgiN
LHATLTVQRSLHETLHRARPAPGRRWLRRSTQRALTRRDIPEPPEDTVGFIQIIDHTTSRPDEVKALVDQMRAEAGPTPAVRRSTVTKDRDRENHYLVIVEFDSYEAAMENSNDPQTSEFAGRLAELLDAPPVFYNLDVVEVMTP